jgi:hypothetical protein
MSEEKKPEDEPKKGPTWEQRTDFRINKQMREVVGMTISATQAQITLLRRKLEKLQYGS